MVDTFRGQIRVRKWPRKRGKPKSEVTRRQNEWFTRANFLAKRLLPSQQSIAIAMTLGTGLYPRDLLLRQMSGGIYDLYEGDGKHYQPRSTARETKVFQGCILQLSSTMVFAAGVAKYVTWPLPVLDTFNFFDLAAPTIITIPPGINVVELQGAISVTPNSGKMIVSLFASVLPLAGESTLLGYNLISGQVVTGPIPVVAGDVFSLRGVVNKTRTTDPARRTFLSLNVLDAD